MPWWAYILAGAPLAGTMAYGQWLGKRTLTQGRQISAISAQNTLRLTMRREDRDTSRRMMTKIDGLCTQVAALDAKVDMLISGRP